MAPPRWLTTASVTLLAVWSTGCGAKDGPAPNGAELTGISHGDTVTSPFTVGMQAEGIDIVAAGDPTPGEGHFHILVDAPCVTGGAVIPDGDAFVHFDNGETEAELNLEPGEHWLCLQVGDGAHTALAPPRSGPVADLTHEIEITVKD